MGRPGRSLPITTSCFHFAYYLYHRTRLLKIASICEPSRPKTSAPWRRREHVCIVLEAIRRSSQPPHCTRYAPAQPNLKRETPTPLAILQRTRPRHERMRPRSHLHPTMLSSDSASLPIATLVATRRGAVVRLMRTPVESIVRWC